jgi:hypothetical protein
LSSTHLTRNVALQSTKVASKSRKTRAQCLKL